MRLSATDARGRFGAPPTLSAAGADAFLSDVATSGQGDALAVWHQAPVGATSTQILASYRRSPNGVFGAPEQLAESALADSPSAAFDPTTQRPSVVWRSRDHTGPGIPLADVKTYVRFVTRVP